MKPETLYTRRLILRKTTIADWKNHISHMIAEDEIYIQYGVEPTKEFIEKIGEMFSQIVYYSVVEKKSGKMIGYVEISENDNNLGFYVFKEFRRRGYCAEALEEFIRAYLSGEMTGETHTSVIAETLSENIISQKLLEKIGFRKSAWGLRMIMPENEESAGPVSLIRYEYEKNGSE